jgi:hypothetical protein
VLIFAIVKFTEGAWLVVLLFPVLWMVLMRLNRRYRDEARALDLVASVRDNAPDVAHYARHTVIVLVDRLDLAVIRALRYAGSIRPTEIRAVHVMLDDQVADHLQREWIARGLGDRVPLTVVECPDRRLVHAVSQLAYDTVIHDRSEVTVLLPRRTFRRISQRLLHDRTADRIAEAVGRIPHVAATIVPFDTTLPPEVIERIEAKQAEAARQPALSTVAHDVASSNGSSRRRNDGGARSNPVPSRPDGTTPIGEVTWKQLVTVQGKVKRVQMGTTAGRALEVQVFDETGGVQLLFFGRTDIAGIRPGAVLRARGRVGDYKGHLALANPWYELVPSE